MRRLPQPGGVVLVLEHRSARLLCQACSGWPSSWRLGSIRLQLALSACLPVRCRPGSFDFLSGQAGRGLSASSVLMLRCSQVDSLWPSFSRLARSFSLSCLLRVRLCPSGPEDMDATPSPARLGAFSSFFQPCPLLTAQVELGPDLGCALLSALALPPVPRLW